MMARISSPMSAEYVLVAWPQKCSATSDSWSAARHLAVRLSLSSFPPPPNLSVKHFSVPWFPAGHGPGPKWMSEHSSSQRTMTRPWID